MYPLMMAHRDISLRSDGMSPLGAQRTKVGVEAGWVGWVGRNDTK